MRDGPPTPERLIPEHLIHDIAAARPTTIADYMAWANTHYYATRDPLGAAGDFTTAPEISQMFGELIGVWIADLWSRAGAPPFRYVELGPGRGTLAADALRAASRFGCAPLGIHLVETSPTLRAAQSARLPEAAHHDEVDALPDDAPLVIVANEFFDALPIHQYVRTTAGWRERMVERQGGKLVPVAGTVSADEAVPPALHRRPEGTIVETAPVAAAIMQRCAFRLARQGGAMLAIDYGYAGPAAGDTLQAVRAHRFADAFTDPGEADLTAHVDFTALAGAARPAGLTVSPLATQGDWLRRLGIDARLKALVAAAPDRADELKGQRDRLVTADAMGDLFKLIAATAPGWPQPAGFADAEGASHE
ncbi:class I SAM-dependent methyltransferase [Sphingopyxis lindanitolerans]